MEKKNNRKIITAVVAIIVLILACLLLFFALTSTSRKLNKQLRIANEYLEDGDYEKAIAAFTDALLIDPNCVEAYEGGAKAYALSGDYESVIAFLQTGYDVTGNEKLLTLIEEYKEEFIGYSESESYSYSKDTSPNLPDSENKKISSAGSLNFEDFRFFGHSLLEGNMIDTIAAEQNIPSIHDAAEPLEPNVKYYKFDDWNWIVTPWVPDPSEAWDGNGNNGTYMIWDDDVRGETLCLSIRINNPFIDEYYEGPIYPGDSIEKIWELIDYTSLTEGVTPRTANGETIYEVTLDSGDYVFSEYKEYDKLVYDYAPPGPYELIVYFMPDNTVELFEVYIYLDEL